MDEAIPAWPFGGQWRMSGNWRKLIEEPFREQRPRRAGRSLDPFLITPAPDAWLQRFLHDRLNGSAPLRRTPLRPNATTRYHALALALPEHRPAHVPAAVIAATLKHVKRIDRNQRNRRCRSPRWRGFFCVQLNRLARVRAAASIGCKWRTPGDSATTGTTTPAWRPAGHDGSRRPAAPGCGGSSESIACYTTHRAG